MEERSQALLSLAKAKLSRRIAFWIFVSIVVIEAILLVPSYFRREQELIDQVENVSAIQARFFLQTAKSMQTEAELIDLAKTIKGDTRIVGWTVENAQGQRLSQMGEVSTLSAANVRDQPISRVRSAKGDRYDVAWNGKPLGSEYILIVRHNVEFIQQDLINYVWRIIGLVAIISVFVTASTF
jgi:adenylate cyclase